MTGTSCLGAPRWRATGAVNPLIMRSFQKIKALGKAGAPYGIRTRVPNVKGWCPRPLDEGSEPLGGGRRYRGVPRRHQALSDRSVRRGRILPENLDRHGLRVSGRGRSGRCEARIQPPGKLCNSPLARRRASAGESRAPPPRVTTAAGRCRSTARWRAREAPAIGLRAHQGMRRTQPGWIRSGLTMGGLLAATIFG
jgi:hypothetical protein